MKKVSIRPGLSDDFSPAHGLAARAIPAGGPPKSQGAATRGAEGQQRFQLDLDGQEPAPRVVAQPSFLRDIVERPSSSRPSVPTAPQLPAFANAGFPVVAKRRPTAAPGKRFAPPPQIDQDEDEDGGDDEYDLAEDDAAIDAESDKLLSDMDETEILSEQAELRKMLGPDMLAFLQKKAAADHPGGAKSLKRPVRPVEQPMSPSPETPLHVQQASSISEMHFTLAGAVDHTASDAHAGHQHAGPSQTYSVSALLRLARSSLSAQRATAYTVMTRLIERYLLRHRDESVAAVLGPHLVEMASLATGALGIAEQSAGVLSAAVLHLHTLAQLSPGPLRPAAPDLLMPLLGGLRRMLAERHLDRARLETALECLELLARETTLVAKICEMPDLLEAAVDLFANVPWPSVDIVEAPSPLVPILLRKLVSASREAAKLVLARRVALVDLLQRYLATPPYGSMLVEVLKLWTAFGRYGLATDLRSSPGVEASLLALESHIARLSYTGAEGELVAAWYELVAVWTACATDPHNTDPPHTIVWTHVDGWGAPLLQAARRACNGNVDPAGRAAAAASVEALAVWVEGAVVNQLPAQLGPVLRSHGPLFARVLELFVSSISSLSSMTGQETEIDGLARLALASHRLLVQDVQERPHTIVMPRFAVSTAPPQALRLLSAILAVEQQDLTVDHCFVILAQLRRGDAFEGQRLAMRCLAAAGLDVDRCKLIRPFVIAACTATCSVAPYRPRAATIPAVETLIPSTEPLFATTWPLACVVDELLGSAQSPLLQVLPPELANEAALVETALAAAAACWQVPSAQPLSADILFECMKVFMLEKDVSPSSTNVGPLFTQPSISSRLLSLVTVHPLTPDSPSGSLALASFPDFYAEFVDLYSALSLGDPLFGRFLLAPLALNQGQTIVGCARTLFHANAPVLRTLDDEAVRGHPALSQKLDWAADEVVQGAISAALKSGELRTERNGLLLELMRRAVAMC